MNRLAVLGFPVAHSRSPAMQGAALEALGLAGEWTYEPIEVEPDELEARLAAMPGEGFVGANVTVPHKEAALALSNDASERAREIGAANTLSFEDEQMLAENTDAPGLLAALPGSPQDKRALVLGAGGAARAVIWALASEGASVELWNRTAERAAKLGAEFGVPVVDADAELPASEFELIVNTTTVGMDGGGDLADLQIDPGAITSDQTVVDLAYGGTATELIRVARERGAEVVDGLEILVRQGAESLRIWTGEDPPLEAMREAARAG